ncbi:DUF2079 domain-containing protein [Streptomyces brasiliensis]|nr:DUF2079 domain-containing protein [Streptomyces brasiliensis]
MAGALFFVYAALSLRIHHRMLSNSYDLGIFEQVVRSYADGHLPVSELKGPGYPILGDHFSPILALVAPFYALHRSAGTLLVVQAALIALSVVPLTLWARRSLGSLAGAVIGACYGLSWGIASAVGFDFHEVAFAAPLLAFSLTALGSGRLTAAAWWALPLLLVKEDLGLTVAVIGLVIAWRGPRKLGFMTAGLGLAGTLLALLVILPAFNPTGSFAYWFLADNPAGSASASGAGAGTGFLDLLSRSTVGLVVPQTKVSTLALMLAPTVFLALRSPLLWAALPTLAWRFFSNNYVHWGTGYHYSLVLMPIVFAAFVDALVQRGTRPAGLKRYLAGAAAVSLLILPSFPFWQLLNPGTWRADPRVAVAHSLMTKIPDDATVQASTYLVPQLTNRTSVSLYGYPVSRPNPQWIMVDTWVSPRWRWPLTYETEHALLTQAQRQGYRTVADRDGFILLHRTWPQREPITGDLDASEHKG